MVSVLHLGIFCVESKREGKQMNGELALVKLLLYADIINWYV